MNFVDDLIFVPLAVALAIRFVPSPVLTECRARAGERMQAMPKVGWLTIGAVWTAAAAFGVALYL